MLIFDDSSEGCTFGHLWLFGYLKDVSPTPRFPYSIKKKKEILRTHFWFFSTGTARLFHGVRVLLSLSQITLQSTLYLATSLPTQLSLLRKDVDPDIDFALPLTSIIYIIPNLRNHVLLLELVGNNCHFGPKETPRGH
ncbi:hypothetical protein TNCV_4767711 [Trichonephila clavipes]|nr:hypothetical protein TNCV_4767711 [Trichonephila clavipes]